MNLALVRVYTRGTQARTSWKGWVSGKRRASWGVRRVTLLCSPDERSIQRDRGYWNCFPPLIVSCWVAVLGPILSFFTLLTCCQVCERLKTCKESVRSRFFDLVQLRASHFDNLTVRRFCPNLEIIISRNFTLHTWFTFVKNMPAVLHVKLHKNITIYFKRLVEFHV